MAASIEEYIFSRKIPGWSKLPVEQKNILKEEARSATYRERGNGALVATVIVTLVLSFAVFGILPFLYLNSWLVGPLAGGLTCAFTLAAGGTMRAYQLLPALTDLVNRTE